MIIAACSNQEIIFGRKKITFSIGFNAQIKSHCLTFN